MKKLITFLSENRGLSIVIACIAFLHILLIANKMYLIRYDDWMSPDQYSAYLNKSDHALRNVDVLYFKVIPQPYINVVYALYFLILIYIISGRKFSMNFKWRMPVFKRTGAITAVMIFSIIVFGSIAIKQYYDLKRLSKAYDAMSYFKYQGDDAIKGLTTENDKLKNEVDKYDVFSKIPIRGQVTDTALLRRLNSGEGIVEVRDGKGKVITDSAEIVDFFKNAKLVKSDATTSDKKKRMLRGLPVIKDPKLLEEFKNDK